MESICCSLGGNSPLTAIGALLGSLLFLMQDREEAPPEFRKISRFPTDLRRALSDDLFTPLQYHSSGLDVHASVLYTKEGVEALSVSTMLAEPVLNLRSLNHVSKVRNK